MLLDWLLAISDAHAEVEQEQSNGSQAPGMTTRDLPNGMREVRINHRALEMED